MADQSGNENEGNLRAALRRLKVELVKLRDALAQSEERADALLQDLLALEHSIPHACSKLTVVPVIPAKPRPASSESEAILEIAGEEGAEKLEVRPLARGAAMVRVNSGKEFRLSPTLAAFLETLLLDGATDGGKLIRWKPHAEVSRVMQARMGRPFSRHALHELVWRLRAALAAAGVNPFFVHTHQQLGLRFAQRRAPVKGQEPL
ncbi:MAG: hypothetical protein EXS35_03355 [Pedosphaera sp.]|nr:hypothetical protein [Pedosphaera sp.]